MIKLSALALLYFLIFLVFLFRSLFSLEHSIFCIENTRSRETKSLMKRSMRKDIVDAKLAILWPWIIFRSVRFLYLRKSLLLKDEK